ncbi:MAG: cation transporter, partial [Arthrobacter sp.]|nr:cation transporter [Arthrobacter sp.]
MSHDHDHAHGGHGHDHTAGASARRLWIALWLTGGFLAAEIAGGFLFGSLALLSDAVHMFTDTAALVIAEATGNEPMQVMQLLLA